MEVLVLILVPVLGFNFSLVESDCAPLESGFPKREFEEGRQGDGAKVTCALYGVNSIITRREKNKTEILSFNHFVHNSSTCSRTVFQLLSHLNTSMLL